MNFDNIVISPPDNYRFLNFVPNVINFILSDIGKSRNRLEVSFNYVYLLKDYSRLHMNLF